jgi:hypothetical protein
MIDIYTELSRPNLQPDLGIELKTIWRRILGQDFQWIIIHTQSSFQPDYRMIKKNNCRQILDRQNLSQIAARLVCGLKQNRNLL